MTGKNKILVGCLALLLALSVGYALFSDTITINGTATAKGNFDITTSCQPGWDESLGTIASLGIQPEGGYKNADCSVNDDEVSISAELEYPGARRYFTIKMTNSGTMDAELDLSTITISGNFCSANNVEGNNSTCEQLSSNLYYEIGKFHMYEIGGLAFEDENGVVTLVDENIPELIEKGFLSSDSTKIIIKPGQSMFYIVAGYFNMLYGDVSGYSEFLLSYDFTLEFLWNQKVSE